jgi:hypothetical protein
MAVASCKGCLYNMDDVRSPAHFDREVMALMLTTNVELVADVLRAEEHSPGRVMRAIAATRQPGHGGRGHPARIR